MRHLSSALVVLWVACLFPLPAATQEKPNRLNLGYSSISGSQAILRVIKDAGIFSKNGLDVSLVLIAGGSGLFKPSSQVIYRSGLLAVNLRYWRACWALIRLSWEGSSIS
jgi:hypothetical protein